MEKSINFKIKLIISILCIFATTLGVVFLCVNNYSKKENIHPANAATISSASELAGISNMNGTYYITKDIDLSGYNWTPIGTMENPFTGELIGNKGGSEYNQTNKVVTIKNLTITLTGKVDRRKSGNVTASFAYNNFGGAESAYRFDGFFGIIKNATIKNIRFENVKYEFEYWAGYDLCGNLALVSFGTICGRTFGKTTIDNCEVVNLDVSLNYYNGGSQNTLFCIGGLVGETYGIGAGREQANKYLNNEPTINLSEASYPQTIISNVLLRGNISIKCDGGNNTTKASLSFHGIAARGVSTSTSDWKTQEATMYITNACFIPEITNMCSFNNKGAWYTDWEEGKNWHRISSQNLGTVVTQENCCANINEIGNLNVCFEDASCDYRNVKHNPKHAFFYDSTIQYKGNGVYESLLTNSKTTPILTSSIEEVVRHDAVINNAYDGVQDVKVSYFKEYYDSYYMRWAPCRLTYSGINTKKLQLGDASIEVTLKSGFETTGWTIVEDDDLVGYIIKIVPKEVDLKFNLPTGVSGVEYNTTSSTVYKVAYIAEITVQYTQLEDYSYQLQFIFTEKNGTIQTITYTIPKQYISTEFKVGKSSVIEVKKEINASTGLTLTITPQLRLKTYGFEFT